MATIFGKGNGSDEPNWRYRPSDQFFNSSSPKGIVPNKSSDTSSAIGKVSCERNSEQNNQRKRSEQCSDLDQNNNIGKMHVERCFHVVSSPPSDRATQDKFTDTVWYIPFVSSLVHILQMFSSTVWNYHGPD
mmetsp:Transcript_6417/g.8707  ORF Transcript_6417/g.8707 Transcript_6417/m.8707 type:complete len:132 (-) Transcript_6417:198-593(-)